MRVERDAATACGSPTAATLAAASAVLWPIEVDAPAGSCALPASVPPSCRSQALTSSALQRQGNDADASMQEEWRRRIVGRASRQKQRGWLGSWVAALVWPCFSTAGQSGRRRLVRGSGVEGGGDQFSVLSFMQQVGGSCDQCARMLSQRRTVWEEPRQGDGQAVWGARPDGSGHHKASK